MLSHVNEGADEGYGQHSYYYPACQIHHCLEHQKGQIIEHECCYPGCDTLEYDHIHCVFAAEFALDCRDCGDARSVDEAEYEH